MGRPSSARRRSSRRRRPSRVPSRRITILNGLISLRQTARCGRASQRRRSQLVRTSVSRPACGLTQSRPSRQTQPSLVRASRPELRSQWRGGQSRRGRRDPCPLGRRRADPRAPARAPTTPRASPHASDYGRTGTATFSKPPSPSADLSAVALSSEKGPRTLGGGNGTPNCSPTESNTSPSHGFSSRRSHVIAA